LLENFLIRRVELLITVGETLRQLFVARGARHTAVVGNWKRLEAFARSEQQNQQVRRRHGIPDGALAVVCITQLMRDRKIEELLECLEAQPDVYLLLGGKGALENRVVQAVSSNPRIRFLGFVPADQIAAYTCAGDVVYYGFDPDNPNARFSAPNKLFEALAAGRPLITGDFGEIAAVVREAGCGVVLPRYGAAEIGNALAVLKDARRRGEMAENAARFGRNHLNWDRAQEILRREYSALLGIALQASGERRGGDRLSVPDDREFEVPVG
jgi:glycosyltransferase involved in cell wall biosynthesis